MASETKFTVQQKAHDETKWVDVEAFESLDAAIVKATQAEKHAPLDQSREFDISARVVQGRKVIWK